MIGAYVIEDGDSANALRGRDVLAASDTDAESKTPGNNEDSNNMMKGMSWSICVVCLLTTT
jgi:hypothetical protein